MSLMNAPGAAVALGTLVALAALVHPLYFVGVGRYYSYFAEATRNIVMKPVNFHSCLEFLIVPDKKSPVTGSTVVPSAEDILAELHAADLRKSSKVKTEQCPATPQDMSSGGDTCPKLATEGAERTEKLKNALEGMEMEQLVKLATNLTTKKVKQFSKQVTETN